MSLLPKIDKDISLSDRAYMILKEAIILNRLTPNMVLTEEQLAKDLGISRTPVRKALEKLAFEKLIRFNPGRGAVVAEISEEDIRQVCDVREAIEPLAARLAARHGGSEEIASFREMIETQRESMGSKDYLLYLQKDYEFHTGVARMSRNELVYEIVRNLNIHVQRFLILSRNLPWKAPLATNEHAAILDALEARDEQAAGRAMMDHVVNVRARIFDRCPDVE